MKNSNAIVLCSGGIDSIVTSFYVKKILKYKKIVILFFDYGQKSLLQERIYSKKCAINLGANFIEIKTNLGKFSTSLINIKKRYKKLSRNELKETKYESSKYYVPSRNLVFIAYATALAEFFFLKDKKKYDIFLGFKNEGREHYPDTSMSFVDKINKLNKVGSLSNPKIMVPLIKKDKEDIIDLGVKIGVNFNNTFSCYIGDKKHCGSCLACMLRKEGFYWSGLKDPTKYSQKN